MEWFSRTVKEEKAPRNAVRLPGGVKGHWRSAVKNLNGAGPASWAQMSSGGDGGVHCGWSSLRQCGGGKEAQRSSEPRDLDVGLWSLSRAKGRENRKG